jgi:hypothetical protein
VWRLVLTHFVLIHHEVVRAQYALCVFAAAELAYGGLRDTTATGVGQ